MDKSTRYDKVLIYCAENRLNGFKLIKKVKRKEKKSLGYFEYYLKSGLFLFHITDRIKNVFIEVRIMENYKNLINRGNIKRIYNSAIKLLEIKRDDYLDINLIMPYIENNDIQSYIDKMMDESALVCERYKRRKEAWENKVKEQEKEWQENKAIRAFNNYYNKDN